MEAPGIVTVEQLMTAKVQGGTSAAAAAAAAASRLAMATQETLEKTVALVPNGMLHMALAAAAAAAGRELMVSPVAVMVGMAGYTAAAARALASRGGGSRLVRVGGREMGAFGVRTPGGWECRELESGCAGQSCQYAFCASRSSSGPTM